MPDGDYRVRVSFARQGRSIVVPRLLHLDTTAPRPRVVKIDPAQVVGPEGARDAHQRARHQPPPQHVLPRRAHRPGRQAGDGARHARTRPAPLGLGRARAPPAGVYVVQVAVRDRAGNFGRTPCLDPAAARREARPRAASPSAASPCSRRCGPSPRARRRPSSSTPAGARTVGHPPRRRRPPGPPRQGRRRRGQAAARARPEGRSGLYLLELQSGRSQTARAVPRPGASHADVLVVLPAITWLGTDPVDDPPVLDGIPDLLTRTGGRVRWPRVFAGEDGLPAGLKSDVAPLLMFLDRAGIRYDLTSDLDLTLSSSPRASDRKGVLLAGSAALGDPADGAPAAPLRARRRPCRDVRHRHAAPRRHAAHGRRRAQRRAGPADAAVRPGPVRERRCRRSKAATRSPSSSSPAIPPTACSRASTARSTASPPSRSPSRRPRAAARACSPPSAAARRATSSPRR